MVNTRLQAFIIPGDPGVATGEGGSEKGVQGCPVSPGVGMGRACFFSLQPSDYPGKEAERAYVHQAALRTAFDQLQAQLSTLALRAESVLDSRTADVFRAHGLICAEIGAQMVQDFQGAQRFPVAHVEKVFDDYAAVFGGSQDGYIRDRAGDFEELKNMLLESLSYSEACLACRDQSGCVVGGCELQNPHIIIADELTASVVIRIEKITKGIVVEKCGVNSHAAVIARSLKIPVISGIKDPLRLVNANDNILIDGETGELMIAPGEATLSKYGKRINVPHSICAAADPVPGFEVCADIEVCGDIEKAVRVKADGIGLYRTEFEVLARGDVLSEREQTEKYQTVVRRMAGKPVYFRLFDLGSDKTASCLDLGKEANPALGCRGARLLLAHPELVRDQARALAMVSREAPVNVIYPMISSLEQFIQLKALFMASIADIDPTNLRHGVMIEVPSLCVNAEALFDIIDFARVGSSDMVQYLYAFDRGRDDFCYDELVRDPAIWNILSHLVEVARRAGKSLGICGALVEDHRFIPRLMELGITTVSTHAENIAVIRHAARKSLTLH